ncbi:hypothetical protein [Steroidobacter denitrificans]|nr:hypothetical protein [Steroidobacter denitrificans]
MAALLACDPATAAPFTVSSTSVSKAPKVKMTFEEKDSSVKSKIAMPKLGFETPVIDGVLEFKIAATYARLEQHDTSVEGPGDSEVKLKWAVAPGDAARGIPAFAMEPKLVLPTGDEARSLGSGSTTLEIPFILGWKLGKTDLGIEFGYSHTFGEHDGTVPLAILGMRQIAPRLRLGLEFVAEAPTNRFSDYELECNVGFKWKLANDIEIDGLYGRTTTTPDDHRTNKAKLVFTKSF